MELKRITHAENCLLYTSVPPLTIREVDCDEAVARLSKSINEVAEGK